MATSGWTRQQALVALNLYCRLPFGRLDHRNPDIVRYAELIGRTPSALAMKLSNFASLDPAITSTGRSGLPNVSNADKSLWDEMQSGWQGFALAATQAEAEFGITPPTDFGVDLDDSAVDYTGKDRAALVTVRIGQRFFRGAVLSAYNNRCCITGLAVPSLLVASHIVPWRESADSRLNPRNGLCLSALHDRAFDAGVITISESLTVNVSKRYSSSDDSFFDTALLEYDGQPIRLPDKFRPADEFLSYHRQNVFKG